MQDNKLFIQDDELFSECVIQLINPHHIPLTPLALNGIQQWNSLQVEGLADALAGENDLIILLNPNEAELSHLPAKAVCRGFCLAVLPFDSTDEQRAALTERVDHLVLAHRDQFKLLIRDLTELLTRSGLIATDLADISLVLNSGKGISHYHSGAGVPRLDTGNLENYLSDALDQHFPHDRLSALSVLSMDFMATTLEDFSAYADYFRSKSIRGWNLYSVRNIYAGEPMRVGCFVVQEASLPRPVEPKVQTKPSQHNEELDIPAFLRKSHH